MSYLKITAVALMLAMVGCHSETKGDGTPAVSTDQRPWKFVWHYRDGGAELDTVPDNPTWANISRCDVNKIADKHGHHFEVVENEYPGFPAFRPFPKFKTMKEGMAHCEKGRIIIPPAAATKGTRP